jgi:hypothetical protein
MTWGSSVGIVSDCRVDDRAFISGRGKGYFLNLSVQTGSEAHPASCPVGAGGPLSGGKARPGRDADHSPHLAKDQEQVGAILPVPFGTCMVVPGQLYYNLTVAEVVQLSV